MEFPRLETFVRVAECGSFNKAAEAGNITSTAVIKQMNLLEDEMNVRLFERTHRGLRLTKAGESFYKDAKYMLKYAHEAELRARKAMWDEGNLIRIGTSPMTPSDAFAEIWPQIHASCPEMRFRIVPFENTPENAAGILGNLGQNIDVVFGILDETMVKLRHCEGFILYDVPICVALALDHPLASKERLTYEDLEGQDLMLMHRGWSSSVDNMRDDLVSKHPGIHIIDFDFYDVDVFNHCAGSQDLVMAVGRWGSVHPMLRVVPVDWPYTIPYGIFYSEDPSPPVEKLLDAVSVIDFQALNQKLPQGN